MTAEEKNKRQRELRKLNNNAYTKKYEKTKNGFLMRVYRNMKSRINGVQKKKAHLYTGKFLIDKESFYKWAKSNKDFHYLFAKYELSGFDRKLAPTVDRIDSKLGYNIENMRWITHSENSRLGSLSRIKNLLILDGKLM